jgi:hypothetical protein
MGTPPNRYFIPFFILLGLAAGCWRYWSLQQTVYGNGWDSYFYLVQLKSLFETGQMHSPEWSLFYPWQAFFILLAGGNYILGYKVGAAALAALFTFVAGYFIHSQIKHPGLTLLVMSWFVYSPHLSYFTAQYPKNLLGVILFIGVLIALGRSFYWTLSVLVITFFSHRMGFALAVTTSLLYWFFEYKKIWLHSLKANKYWILGFIGILAGLMAFIPGILNWTDLGRFNGFLSPLPQFAPWSFFTSFGSPRISVFWLVELVCACLFLVYFWARPTRPALLSALATTCILLLFPFLEWSFTGMAYRFFMVFVLLAPLLLAARPIPMLWVPTLALLLASSWSWRSYNPGMHDPDYRLFDQCSQKAASILQNHNPSPELLIAPNALAAFYTFSQKTDAMPWIPEYPIAEDKLWRIAGSMWRKEVAYFAQDSQVYQLPGRYVLLREKSWQNAIQHARSTQDSAFLNQALNWPNPSQKRPAFLLKKKKR